MVLLDFDLFGYCCGRFGFCWLLLRCCCFWFCVMRVFVVLVEVGLLIVYGIA